VRAVRGVWASGVVLVDWRRAEREAMNAMEEWRLWLRVAEEAGSRLCGSMGSELLTIAKLDIDEHNNR
jgi:hypothetical protein